MAKKSVKTLPAKKRATKKAKAEPKQKKQIAKNKTIKRGAHGEVKSIKDLPKAKRPGSRQIEKAINAKAIKVTPKVIARRFGRYEVSLGEHPIENVAGVVKGFRQKHKADFGTIIKDKDGNVIARTHIARGNRSTIPEQLAVKAVSKYGRGMDTVKIVISVKPRTVEQKAKVRAAKNATKKKAPVKKAAKKATKKKAAPKKDESYTVKGYTKTGKPIKRKSKLVLAAPKKRKPKK